jgi:hypothetical protein
VRLLEMLEFPLGAFDAIAYVALELVRSGDEDAAPMVERTADVLLEVADI